MDGLPIIRSIGRATINLYMMAFLLFLLTAGIDDLSARFAKLGPEAQGRAGVAAILLETGEMAAFHGGDRFPMQSVYKFPIAMAALHEVDRGALRLDQNVVVTSKDMVPAGLHSPIRDEHSQGVTVTVRELLRYTVSESDGTTSDVLLRLVGGPSSVMRFLRSLGIDGIMVRTTEMQMSRGPMVQYLNWAQPSSMAALLRAFHLGKGLSSTSRALLEDLMIHSSPGAKRIPGLLPAGAVVAHKTGTSGTDSGLTRATNDVGIITLPDGRHIAIAVFIADSKAKLDIRESVIAKMSKAAWDHWR
jgi:beta-lactamase class A